MRFRLHLEPVIGKIFLDELCFEHIEDIKTTMRYTHTHDEQCRNAALMLL